MKSYSIGRDNACDIVLNDQSDVISRRHAVLNVLDSGKMTITDLSTNGTYINGQKITSNVPVPVSRKDTVSFAHVCTLDWNMVPKSGKMRTYLLIGLGVALIAALALVYFLRKDSSPVEPEVTPIAVDTTTAVQQQEEQPEIATYSVTYDPNGGEGSVGVQQVPVGKKAGLIGNTFTREGYDFVGWNTQADGQGTAYEDRATLELSENITLYAQWKQRIHKITFVPNARKVRNTMAEQEVAEGTDTEIAKNEFKMNGFTFVGWNTQADGKGTAYSDQALVNLKEDLTLYAQWRANGNTQNDKPAEPEPEPEEPQNPDKGLGRF